MTKPEWLTIQYEQTNEFVNLKDIIKQNKLHTVCEEAHCPNKTECWNDSTATFMVLGDTCTRACKFCAVKTAFPAPPVDLSEPANLALAVKQIRLEYVVITSVDRDDLKDQGAGHFAECISAIKRETNGKTIVEVLTPDFRGSRECVEKIVKAGPDVFAHNIETVKRLQHPTRDPRAGYEQSLSVLKAVKEINPKVFTKSGMMLGLGEQDEEVLQAMQDLLAVGVDFLTLGQYLRPASDWYLPVVEYVTPEKFVWFREQGEKLGFKYVAAGPFVRSSYKAKENFVKSLIEREKHA